MIAYATESVSHQARHEKNRASDHIRLRLMYRLTVLTTFAFRRHQIDTNSMCVAKPHSRDSDTNVIVEAVWLLPRGNLSE